MQLTSRDTLPMIQLCSGLEPAAALQLVRSNTLGCNLKDRATDSLSKTGHDNIYINKPSVTQICTQPMPVKANRNPLIFERH